MRVFLSEYCTCGGDPAAAQGPLFAEGAAMLRALAEDAAKVDGVNVVVTWAAGLEPFGVPGVEVVEVPGSPSPLGGAPGRTFERIFWTADAVLHVAPESDRRLFWQAEFCAERNRWSGCTPEAIRVCGDKREADRALRTAGVRRPWVPGGTVAVAPPFVMKPADGAGGDGLVFRTNDDLSNLTPAAAREGGLDLFFAADATVTEGWVTGRPCSVAVINHEPLPAGVQDVRIDGSPGRLSYHGGSIPAADVDGDAVRRLVAQVSQAVPGLRGWWGIDFVIPDEPFPPGDPHGSRDPVLIEVNPRLTTSLLGYRALTDDNLAERILFPERPFPPVRWKAGTATFNKAGAVMMSEPF